jgi:hypothetical protein
MAGPEPVHPLARAFVQGLRALGYAEGQNLILERRSAEGQHRRFGDLVAELVRLKADVIVTAGDPLPRAAKAVTTTRRVEAGYRPFFSLTDNLTLSQKHVFLTAKKRRTKGA